MKKSIFALTPNPALDLSGTVKRLKINEKIYVQNELRAPGGNAINAARILSRLKIPVITSGFIGGGVGEEVQALIKSENLRSEFIEIQSQTRINVTISNERDHNQTRLSFPGPSVKNSEKKKLFNLIKRQKNLSSILIGGSLPSGFTPKDVARIIQISTQNSIPSIVDCPGSILAQTISSGPMLIKPNLEEFQELTRSRVSTLGSVIEKAKKLLQHVQCVCVSSVEGGAVLITSNNIYFGRIPKINVRSTVGAGDSMVGALVARLYNGHSLNEDALRWALAAAAATLSHSGTTLGSYKEIVDLYKKTHVKTLRQ